MVAKVLLDHRKRGRPGNQEEDHTPLGSLHSAVHSAPQCSATNVSAIPTRKIFGQLADMHDNGSRDDHDHADHYFHHKENDSENPTINCNVDSTFYTSLFRQSIQRIRINVATSYFKHSQCNVLIIMKIEAVHVCVSLR